MSLFHWGRSCGASIKRGVLNVRLLDRFQENSSVDLLNRNGDRCLIAWKCHSYTIFPRAAASSWPRGEDRCFKGNHWALRSHLAALSCPRRLVGGGGGVSFIFKWVHLFCVCVCSGSCFRVHYSDCTQPAVFPLYSYMHSDRAAILHHVKCWLICRLFCEWCTQVEKNENLSILYFLTSSRWILLKPGFDFCSYIKRAVCIWQTVECIFSLFLMLFLPFLPCLH